MSVIGRLDEQVDAVLIGPLNRSARTDAEAQEREAGERPSASPRSAQAEQEAEKPHGEGAGQKELPVWLL